uniref:ABM domain-containing protein n=1 Tax=Aplanochytrium stocchinoi TaxID=215587 RepID=A0A6S7ZPZ2_9STRA|mmetsp:Transcript_3765/g.4695  ORF Transcript_3765/g.4695 Transcript_3765/m.4695 type:complete len:112 (-) Transcript_3765:485-820(-)
MSRVATIPLRKIIRMSERYVSPKHEYKVREVMKSVETNLRRWPGLLSIETLVDTEEANKYVVITEWDSRASMKKWLNSDICKDTVKELDKVLDKPVSYREFMHHEDNVFLL